MRTELISIATDTFPLDGAYYEPEDREILGSVLLMHGNCMNFYVGAPRFLPPLLTELGLACLAYNRRGHDVLSTRDSRDLEGGAYQTIAEARADNDFAGHWLRAKGFGAPVVIGHSNGGMLGVQYTVDHPDTPALVLLSAHAGGPDIAATISAAGIWAGARYDDLARTATDSMSAGNPRDLLLLDGWWRVIGAQSAIDFMSAVPAILDLAEKITCPVLFLKGDEEPEAIYPANEFSKKCSGPCEIEIIENCGHFYVGREPEVGACVSNWLARQPLLIDGRR